MDRPRVAAFVLVLAASIVATGGALADHVSGTEGTRNGWRCDGGWCDHGSYPVIDCAGMATGAGCTGTGGGFPTITNPSFGDGAWLEPADIVIGVARGAEAKAYPVRLITGAGGWEMVEDDVDGHPVIVTYCPLCKSGVAWSRIVGDETLTFRNSGAIWNYDLVMVDTATRSAWSQVAGEGIGRPATKGFEDGPMHGRTLDLVGGTMVQWAAWKDAHPGAVAMERPINAAGAALCTCPPFRAHGDWVLGIELRGGAIAFPHSVLEDVGSLHVSFRGTGLFAVWTGRSVQVFEATGRDLSWDGSAIADPATGERFHPITGGPESGVGGGLAAVAGITAALAEWQNFHPDTVVVTDTGGTEAPPEPEQRIPAFGAMASALVVGAAAGLGAARGTKRP